MRTYPYSVNLSDEIALSQALEQEIAFGQHFPDV